MTKKSCVICGGQESEGELLVEAPCDRHWVCSDDVSAFFARATENESLYPPKCCGQIFMLQEYEEYVPFEVSWAYQVKEQGEYAILAKFRVYCGNSSCAKLLHPSLHVINPETKIAYAICEDETCGISTCTSCKMLLKQGAQSHICRKDENDEKFKQAAMENGYQVCNVCGVTVELSEACNHIKCKCGHEFCYVCGKNWGGLHGCPRYGKAIYDTDGYNQNGYHRDTGLNREGLTHRQESRRHQDTDDENNEDEDDPGWDVLQHLAADQRMLVNALDGTAREDALDQFRIELFETRGILFRQDLEQDMDGQEAEDRDANNQDGDDDDDASDHNNGHNADEEAAPRWNQIPDNTWATPHWEGELEDGLAAEVTYDASLDWPTVTAEQSGEFDALDVQDLGLTGSGRGRIRRHRRNESGDFRIMRSDFEFDYMETTTTNPEDSEPSTLLDHGRSAGVISQNAETTERGTMDMLWGPPGGWPEGEDEEL